MTPLPKRIQRKRTLGWRAPPNTLYVGRPTVFGNPFLDEAAFRRWIETRGKGDVLFPYRLRCLINALPRLRGKNLACWCRLDSPCHASVLLELANR